MRVLTRPGNLLIVAVVITPVVVAFWRAGGVPPSTAGLLNLLGRLAGVAGLALMFVAAAVSIRIPRLDQPFGGLTELWKVHHVLGAAAFLLLLAHPLLLAFSAAASSPGAAAALLVPPAGAVGIWLGWASLVAMMVFLAPTFSFFGAPHYQRWKRLHALSAVAVVLGFAHTVALGRGLPLWVWWLFAMLALAALSFRLVWRKLHPGERFRVAEVKPLADRVVEIALEPLSGKTFRYEPGQFVYLSPLDEALTAGRREEHPYTICSAPQDAHVRVAVKDLGDASGALQSVRVGTDAFIDGPYGRFFEPGEQGRELWIGGGIGITPFVGRARALAVEGGPVDIDLVYCVNDASRAYYLDVLRGVAEVVPGFRVWPHFFADEGPLDAAWIEARCGDAPARRLYACGPKPLLRCIESIRRAFAIPRSRYNSEEFDFL